MHDEENGENGYVQWYLDALAEAEETVEWYEQEIDNQLAKIAELKYQAKQLRKELKDKRRELKRLIRKNKAMYLSWDYWWIEDIEGYVT